MAAIVFVATPALAADRIFTTPSGQPEVTFKATPLADASSKVANNCMNSGWMIVSQAPNQVVCEIRMDLMRSAITQALIGNSYSTPPRSLVRVSLAQIGENVRAQAASWVETQMAFGQMRQQPYDDANTYNRLMAFLINAGGGLTTGTTRPGVLVGFIGQPESDGQRISIPVKLVNRNTPAEAAGLQAGDRILKVNGKSFKDMDDLRNKVGKVGLGNRYPVLISRNGIEQTLMLEAKPWPVAGSPEALALEEAGKSPGTPKAPANSTSAIASP